MDAIQFLLTEHQAVRQRFAEIERAGPQARGELWHNLQPELKIHEEIEDTYLYGPLSRDPAAQGTPLATFEQRQDQDVQQLEQKRRELNRHDPADDAWLARLREIRDALMEHVRVEEEEILPQVGQVWGRDRLNLAGRQMADAKQEAMQSPERYAKVLTQPASRSEGGPAR
jgi:hemerythrin-like domain-containing protein